MCTISWFFGEESSHVFFNRDEQKKRATAVLPAIITSGNNVGTIMPIDPVGGGSWLVVNEHGWTFALLNFYQGRLPKGKLRSRGEIIRGVSGFNLFSDVHLFLKKMVLEKYAPFSLLCIAPLDSMAQDDKPPHQNVLANTVTMLRWTGKELDITAQSSPFFSSAVNFDEVVAERLRQANASLVGRLSEQQRLEKHIALHSSHEPMASAYSICMHRDDAHTVSFSHIQITQNNVIYKYTDGAPCKAQAVAIQQLYRISP